MRFILIVLVIAMVCNNQKNPQENESIPLLGTWELISSTTIQGDSLQHSDLTGKKMIKIINKSHFAFFNHDINKEKDSLTFFVSGGGKYQLKGNQYT